MTERSSQRRDARRVTVGEAAALLGISKEAVRMRIRRGTLRSEKSDDRVYVWLDEDLGANQGDVHHADQGAAYRELIEQLRAEVEAWREEARRKDHIIAGLIERLPPQLEAPPDEPGADLTATEEPGKGEGPTHRSLQAAPGGGGCWEDRRKGMAEGLRLEDWIGKRVTVNLYSTAEVVRKNTVIKGMDVVSEEETTSDRPLIIAVEGFLEGVDLSGVIVLFDPERDVSNQRGRVRSTGPEQSPRHVFYPWQRVSLVERIEEAEE